jgi:hypothetical protein
MSDVGNHSSAGTVDIALSGKIEEINAFSPVQPLVVAGKIEKKDATLIELYRRFQRSYDFQHRTFQSMSAGSPV